MKPVGSRRAQRRYLREQAEGLARFSLARLGLDAGRYEALRAYLFDVPESLATGDVMDYYFWNRDSLSFDPTPLEWVHFQTALFAQAGTTLAQHSDDQLGAGLNYLMSAGLGDAAIAPACESVPMIDAARMLEAMLLLWRDAVAPRMAGVHDEPIGSGDYGLLGYVCHMWFDAWPTGNLMARGAPLRDALWRLFDDMLDIPCRSVQTCALHGIGHSKRELARDAMVERRLGHFAAAVEATDPDLGAYARAAATGRIL